MTIIAVMQRLYALLTVITIHETLAFFKDSPYVRTLDNAAYDTLVRQTSTVWLVDFYAPWCPHCSHFAPQYERIARALASSNIKIGAVDCVETSSVCDDEKVEMYPSIRLLQIPSDNNKTLIFDNRRFTVSRDIIDWVVEQCVKAGIDTGAIDYEVPSEDLADNEAKAMNQNAIAPLDDSIQLKYARLCEAGATALYTLESSIFLGTSSLSSQRYDAAILWMEALAASFPLAQNREAFGKLLLQFRKEESWVKKEWRKVFFTWRAEVKSTMFPLCMFEIVKQGTKDDGSAMMQEKSEGREWRNCRTFTCGLWTLFHSMTVNVRYKGCKLRPSQVAIAIRSFVEHFFGCEECADHFLEANPPDVMSTLQDMDHDGGAASILWLWEMHNAVNDRTEKALWPTSRVCKTCYFEKEEEIEVNRTRLVSYMIASYQQSEDDVWSLRYNVEGIGEAIRGSISKQVKHYLLLISALMFSGWIVYLLVRPRRRSGYHFLKAHRAHIA